MAGEIPSTSTQGTDSAADAAAYAESLDAGADAAGTGASTDTGTTTGSTETGTDPTTVYADGETGDAGAESSNTNSTSTNSSTSSANSTDATGATGAGYETPDYPESSSAAASETLTYEKALAQASTYNDEWMKARMAEFQKSIDAANTPEQMGQVWQQNIKPVVDAVVPPPAEQMAQKKEDETKKQHAEQMSQAHLAMFANKNTAQALLKSYKNRLATLTQAAKKSGSAQYQEYVKLLPQVNARQSDLANARERSRFLLEGQTFQAEEFVQEKLSDFNQLISRASKIAGEAGNKLALTAKEKFNLLKDNLGKAVAGEGMLFDKDQKALTQNQKQELNNLAKDAATEAPGKTVEEMKLTAEIREHEAGRIGAEQATDVDEAQNAVADLNNGAVLRPPTGEKIKAIALLEAAGRLTFEQAKELKDKALKAANNMMSGGLIAAAPTDEEAQSAAIQGLLANAAPDLNGPRSAEEKGQARFDLTSAHKAITEGKAYKLAEQKALQVKAQVQAGVAGVQAKAQQVSQGVASAVTYTPDTANDLLTKTREELAEKTSFMNSTVGAWEDSLADTFGYYTQWTRSKLDMGNGETRVATLQAGDPSSKV